MPRLRRGDPDQRDHLPPGRRKGRTGPEGQVPAARTGSGGEREAATDQGGGIRPPGSGAGQSRYCRAEDASGTAGEAVSIARTGGSEAASSGKRRKTQSRREGRTRITKTEARPGGARTSP